MLWLRLSRPAKLGPALQSAKSLRKPALWRPVRRPSTPAPRYSSSTKAGTRTPASSRTQALSEEGHQTLGLRKRPSPAPRLVTVRTVTRGRIAAPSWPQRATLRHQSHAPSQRPPVEGEIDSLSVASPVRLSNAAMKADMLQCCLHTTATIPTLLPKLHLKGADVSPQGVWLRLVLQEVNCVGGRRHVDVDLARLAVQRDVAG